jgi:hypothetical protein
MTHDAGILTMTLMGELWEDAGGVLENIPRLSGRGM